MLDPRHAPIPDPRAWAGRRVTVTGGAGFLGSPLVGRLASLGAQVHVPRKADYDLTSLDRCLACLSESPAEVVIHCAAFYGGIWINQLHPGRIYYENLVMGAHLMEAARRLGVERFVAIGTACSYPGYLEGDLREEALWDGPLHDSVANYGLTKKCMAVQGAAYRKEYDFRSIHLILTNLYGPGDTFHLRRAHVVSALIKKFVEARREGRPAVEVWGTGSPVREFLYVDDCAEGVLRAATVYDDPLPLNLGTGVGTSIRELAETIREESGFEGQLVWDATKPDGCARKVLDVQRMVRVLGGWRPPTRLREGLRRTIAWYEAHKEEADARL